MKVYYIHILQVQLLGMCWFWFWCR